MRDAGLHINVSKSAFAVAECEYLGYVLSRDGIKPQPEKVRAILALQPPTSIKSLRRFLGIVQYYRDLWEKQSNMLVPFTDLVSKCGVTKTTKKTGTKKKPWRWSKKYQRAFDLVK